MAAGVRPLPPPAPDQAYCDVSALEGGFLTLHCKMAVAGLDDSDQHLVPSLAFLLTHVPSGKHLLFDLGINLDPDNLALTPAVKKAIEGTGMHVPKDVITSLKAGGFEPDDITHICLSHVHVDHIGNPAKFGKTQFLVGGATRTLLKPGYPEDQTSWFDSRLLPEDRTTFLDTHGDDWKRVGPFERALDYFGDGSIYLVDAPGHLLGHINLIARTSSDGAWIYLTGDSAHDWRLIRDQAEIAVFPDPGGGYTCMHSDLSQAKETIRRIAEVMTLPRVRVVLTHDNEWYEENKDGSAFWPGKIPSL